MNEITNYLNEHLNDMIALTEKIINIDSFPTDVAGVQKVIDVLTDQMHELGMETRQIDAGNPGTVLIGELAGQDDTAPVILSGHMDTVFPAGTVAHHPFLLDGDKMMGPGIFDMKPGLVIALFAVQALKELGKIKRPIKMIFVSDEEKLHLGSNGHDILATEAKGGAYGINLEGSVAHDKVGTSNRGGMIIDVTVHGIAAHSGAAPEKGRSAIIELAHQMIEFDTLTDLANGIHVNCGTVQGGVSENIIPDLAKTSMGVRFKTNQQRDELLAKIKKIVTQPTIDGTKTEVTVRTQIDSMEDTPEVETLFADLNRVAEEIGYGTLHGGRGGGASDAGVLVSQGVPTIDGMGVIGEGSHTDHENSSAKSMVDRASLIANLIAERG